MPDRRDAFLEALQSLINQFDGEEELNAELAVLASLGTFACANQTGVLLAHIEPVTMDIIKAYMQSIARNN